MVLLKVFDKNDYMDDWPRRVRSAARAIIFAGEKLALIKSKRFGEYKFPGGGVKPGESAARALIRETREETGLTVIEDSITDFGMTIEIRRDRLNEGTVFQHNSYYFMCGVENEMSRTRLDKYEKEYGYALCISGLDEAIGANRVLVGKNIYPWLERELFILEAIKTAGAG